MHPKAHSNGIQKKKKACVRLDVEVGYKLSKTLRKSEAHIQAVELKWELQKASSKDWICGLMFGASPLVTAILTHWISPGCGKNLVLHIFNNA